MWKHLTSYSGITRTSHSTHLPHHTTPHLLKHLTSYPGIIDDPHTTHLHPFHTTPHLLKHFTSYPGITGHTTPHTFYTPHTYTPVEPSHLLSWCHRPPPHHTSHHTHLLKHLTSYPGVIGHPHTTHHITHLPHHTTYLPHHTTHTCWTISPPILAS